MKKKETLCHLFYHNFWRDASALLLHSLQESVDLASCLLDVELSEDHVGGLGDFLWLGSEADLVGVLRLERHAVLLELLVGLWFALWASALAPWRRILNERLQAEFNSDGH